MTLPNNYIQPSSEEFGEWLAEACKQFPAGRPGDIAGVVARMAYSAGADAELKASCEALEKGPYGASCVANGVIDWLQHTRRPKSASLKKQALESLDKALTF